MSFEEVPYCRVIRSPKSLFDISLRRVAEVFDRNDINTGYLNHVIPEILYTPICEMQKVVARPLQHHDWSVCSSLHPEIYFELMNYDPEDGVPDFAYEYNYLKIEFIEMERSVFSTVRFCLPCYNTYCRHRFVDMHTTMTLCRERMYVEGEDLIGTMQWPRLWCHRCYTQPLFVIKKCDRSTYTRHLFSQQRIYERALTKR